MYRYLYPQLHSTLQSVGRTIEEKNGFELYRLVSQECDRVGDLQPHVLITEIHLMMAKKSTSFAETSKLFVDMDAKAREYHDKSGQHVTEEL